MMWHHLLVRLADDPITLIPSPRRASSETLPPAPAAPLPAGRWRWLFWAVVGLAWAGQIRVWANDRGLWHDELYVAVNLQKKQFVTLPGGLYWNQTAPPGWLVVEKALYKVLGQSEHLLRLPQLISAMLVAVLTVVIARHAVGRWAAVVSCLLVGISPMLLYYSGELKQYAGEAASALAGILAMWWLAEKFRGGRASRRQVIAAGVVGVGCVAISYTALLVLAGALAGAVAVFAWRRDRRACLVLVLAALPGLAVGSAQVMLRMRFGLLGDQAAYFVDGLPPSGSGPLEAIGAIPGIWAAFVRTPAYLHWPAIVCLVAVVGLVGLARRGRVLWSAIFAGVFAAALGAALVGGMPLVERVAVYLVAPLLIVFVAGLDTLARFLISAWRAMEDRPWSLAPAVLALALAAAGLWSLQPAVAGGYNQLAQPMIVAPYQGSPPTWGMDNGRALMREVAARWRPGDVLLGYWYTQPLISWYGDQYGLRVAGYADWTPAGQCGPLGIKDIVGDARRVWYVHLENLSSHPNDFHQRVLLELANQGRIVESRVWGGGEFWQPAAGAWVLVDLSAPSNGVTTVPPAESATAGCVRFDRDWT